MGLTLITPAATLPVTLAEVKTLCKIEDASFDDELELLLPGACSAIEEYTGRPLGAQTWRLTLDGFSDAIELPKAPATTPLTVEYTDTNGLTQIASTALYSLDLASQPQWVVLNEGESWPETASAVGAVRVNFTAGYTDSTIPPGLKLAVAALVKHWWENGIDAGMPATVQFHAAPWRSLWVCA